MAPDAVSPPGLPGRPGCDRTSVAAVTFNGRLGGAGRVVEQRDFFISYTGADQSWAEWIADTLEQDGHTTLLQAWDFRPGSDFVEQMHQAIEQTKRTIAVLSERYLASIFAAAEWHAIFAKDPTGQAGLLVPVRIQDCEPPGLLRTRVYIDLVGLEEAEAATRLCAGVGRARAKPAGKRPYPGRPPKAGGASFPGRRPAIFNVPPRNPHFTGRDDLLAALRRSLTETSAGAVVQASAVHGLGGVGKTQLAIEYAHRHASNYDLIWWIRAEQPLAIPGQLVPFARRLGIPEQADQGETIQALWEELRQRDHWLLVFDSAEAPQDLRASWPPGGQGQVLITSRNPAWGGLAATLPMDVLQRAEAVTFLGRRLGRDDPTSDFDGLAAALGDLPLALEQAAAYLEETATPTGEYLILLATHAKELFRLGRPATTEQTIATTWTVSLQRLRQQTPAAEDLLMLYAFLAPDDIPRSLPTKHPDMLPERLAATVRAPLAYQQAIGALRRYSLIKTSEDGNALSVHRLVQAVTRQQLNDVQEHQWRTAALHLLRAAFPNRHTDPDAWPDYARLLPHVVAVTDHASAGDIDVDKTNWLLTQAGLYLLQRADYRQARSLFERVLAIDEARLDADHLTIAQSLNSLAVVLRGQGGLDGAHTLHERALAIRETRLVGRQS
jgi:tetratricopeptide (TPR) repeat protein